MMQMVNGDQLVMYGKYIASARGDTIVQVWDAATGDTIFTYHGYTSWVNAVAWSPNGLRIASSGWNDTVRVWDARKCSHRLI